MNALRRTRLILDDGMGLIEVLMAMVVLITGVVGAVGALDGVRSLGSLQEKKQEAARYAEQEVEHIRSLGWASLQLSATPAEMNDSRGTVAGTTYAPPRGGGTQNLVIATSCPTSTSCVDPGPTAWSAGNASGLVYRYITMDDDTACGSACTPTVDRKRVTVAITINAPSNLTQAIVYSTLIIDPTARPNGTTAPTNPLTSTSGTSIGSATGTTYYFSDTPTGSTYAAPNSNHSVRDTVGGGGVPDQLRLGTPSAPANNQADAYSYSTDVSPNNDPGLGVAGSSNCSGSTRQTAHEWVTPVINASAAATATGNAAITLPTSTWGAAYTGGKVCVSVYNVALDGSNHYATNTLLGAVTYQLPVWPSATDIVAFPFRYLAAGTTSSLAAGRRLGIRLTVDSAAVSGLTFDYDHPNALASVQLETQ